MDAHECPLGVRQDDVDNLRMRMHDLADKLGAVVTRVEVSAVRLEAASTQIARIDSDLRETQGAVIALQTRANEATNQASREGAKWGGVVGGAIGAAAWLYSVLGGK